jgi:hypothetical protein
MRRLILVAALVVVAHSAAAQVGPDAAVRDALRLESPAARRGADLVSTGLVVFTITMPCLILDRHWRCFANQGLQLGTGIATAELSKFLVHRTRPNGRDRKSWLSEHSTIACIDDGLSHVWAICPAVMLLRIEADEHWLTDTGGGLALAIVVHKTLPQWRTPK